MEMLRSAINWFEIPVLEFDRAKQFYQTIFDYEMPENQMGPNRMGFFLYQQGEGIGGSIVQGPGYQPSMDGAKIYLNAGEDLSPVLARVKAAGGKVLLEKTEITPDVGYFAMIRDSEGNKVCLHSMN